MSDLDRDDSVRDLLRRARPAGQLDPVRTARVREAVLAVWLEETPLPRRRWWWAGAGVAAAAALVAAVVLLGQPTPPSPNDKVERIERGGAGVAFLRGDVRVSAGTATGARAAYVPQFLEPGATVVTGEGRGTIRMTDGVEVRLDRDTQIALLPGSGVYARLSVQRGAIYVDTSEREGAQPLEVEAHGAVLQDIGTRYEVRVSSAGLRVRVRQGRVRVARGADVQEAAAGSQLLVTDTGTQMSAAPPFGSDWDWIVRAARSPQVEGRSLAEFLAWVEREGGRRVRFADRALERDAATTMVYGVIDGLSVEDALAVVLASCGLTHHTSGATITIVSADEPRGGR